MNDWQACPGRDGLGAAVSGISRWLTNLYALEFDFDFEAAHFLVSPEDAGRLRSQGGPRTGLLIVEEGEELSLGLYVDESDVGNLGTLVEETSHLVCVAWHGARNLPVSQLLLELQGDIDRYLFRRLSHSPQPIADPFEGFRWADWLDASTRARYRAAHQRARRYCCELERRFPRRADVPALLREVRAFYRAPLEARLRCSVGAAA